MTAEVTPETLTWGQFIDARSNQATAELAARLARATLSCDRAEIAAAMLDLCRALNGN